MKRAIDCAAYLISLSIHRNNLINNLQLQKMLFLAYIDYMVSHDGERLFDDNIYAWQYGPVIPLVYNAYSHYGGSPIRGIADSRGGTIVSSDLRLDDSEMERSIMRVYEKWSDLPAWLLVAEIDKPGSAWNRIYNQNGEPGSGCGCIIDDTTIMDCEKRKS